MKHDNRAHKIIDNLKNVRPILKEVPKPEYFSVESETMEYVYNKALEHHYTVMEMAIACNKYEENKVMVALQCLLNRRLILSYEGHLHKR